MLSILFYLNFETSNTVQKILRYDIKISYTYKAYFKDYVWRITNDHNLVKKTV